MKRPISVIIGLLLLVSFVSGYVFGYIDYYKPLGFLEQLQLDLNQPHNTTIINESYVCRHHTRDDWSYLESLGYKVEAQGGYYNNSSAHSILILKIPISNGVIQSPDYFNKWNKTYTYYDFDYFNDTINWQDEVSE